MNGGFSQEARILRLVDEEYAAGLHLDHLEAYNRATHADALRELQLVELAERLQIEDRPPTPRELIRTIGWRRLAIAAAFAATVWIGTAAFAVMCGGPR